MSIQLWSEMLYVIVGGVFEGVDGCFPWSVTDWWLYVTEVLVPREGDHKCIMIREALAPWIRVWLFMGRDWPSNQYVIQSAAVAGDFPIAILLDLKEGVRSILT